MPRGSASTHVFDANPQIAGKRVAQFTVRPMSELESTIEKNQIRLGMIAIPADHAQDVVNQLVAAGIRGILELAPHERDRCRRTSRSNAVELVGQTRAVEFPGEFPGLVADRELPETGTVGRVRGGRTHFLAGTGAGNIDC